MLEIRAAATRRELSEFVALPYRLHAQDAQWVPPLRRDVRLLLSRKRNPFFEHAEAEYFLARRAGRVVGRIAAIHNRRHNQLHGERLGFFGFFECEDDPAAAAALFDTTAGWLRARRLECLRGPASFSMNDECGLLVDGFDSPPTVMMPHNPRRYVALLEGCGFRGVKDLLVYQTDGERLPQRLVAGAERLQRRYDIRLRTLDKRRFGAEVELVRALYNQSWERNWGFVPMSDHEIDQLAAQLKPVVVPELVVFAEHAGKTIGFAVALPDLNVALKANPGGRLFPGILRVLWASRRIRRLRVMLLGTLPEWRGKGVDAVIYKYFWERHRGLGYRWAEAGWILEDNHVMRNGLTRMGFEAYKTYRMYERSLLSPA